MEILDLEDAGSPGVARATEVLEAGGLVRFSRRPFLVEPEEQAMLDPAILAERSKNVSLDPATGGVRGSRLTGARAQAAAVMISRFATWAERLMGETAPGYAPHLQRRRTSFRPAPVDTRVLSARKDDRRLHVDAFPASPVQGRRILRVFANVDPQERPRVWNVGEDDFESLARHFDPPTGGGGAGAWFHARLGLTRGRRTAYDAAMLALHDRTKLDAAWQGSAAFRRVEFAAGSSWVVFTDSVLHAALSGQHAFEQTWLLPVEALQRPERSPLRVLERMAGKALA